MMTKLIVIVCTAVAPIATAAGFALSGGGWVAVELFTAAAARKRARRLVCAQDSCCCGPFQEVLSLLG